MTADDDIDGLAAEYVLGSLDLSEREAVGDRRKTDAALDQALRTWERRLGPLADRMPGIEPPAHLFDSILARLPARGAKIIPISARAKAGTWRRVAIASSALAACIALAVIWFTLAPSSPPMRLVAELHRPHNATADETTGPKSPVFVVTVDLEARKATVRPIAARSRSGRSYQLWIAADEAAPRSSLGVVSHSDSVTLPLPAGLPPSQFVNGTLTVSLEPEGGSPTGQPTGPIMFVGKLAPAEQ